MANKGIAKTTVDFDPFVVMEVIMVSFSSSHKPDAKEKGKGNKVYKQIRVSKQEGQKVVENNKQSVTKQLEVAKHITFVFDHLGMPEPRLVVLESIQGASISKRKLKPGIDEPQHDPAKP